MTPLRVSNLNLFLAIRTHDWLTDFRILYARPGEGRHRVFVILSMAYFAIPEYSKKLANQ